MNLSNCSGLLTGAGSGIGRALALALSAKGARLILTDRNLEGLRETREMAGGGNHLLIVEGDVTQADDRRKLRQVAETEFKRLDLLINNAGVIAVMPHGEIGDEMLERQVAVNLVAPMALVRDLLPLLISSRPSRVVNIGSMFGDIAFPLFAAYSATKFGVRGFSDALRRELAPDGVGVTYCAPRATKTPASKQFEHLVGPFAMKFDSPETVAAQIVGAIESDARSVYPMGPERLFVLVQRLFPFLVDGSLIGQFKRAKL
ncbi:MAG: SDR family NAD(P)-dependent oxidoreductase [Alphaproteobacteria bacterium]|nr:SDR family NAD(P)-dependent oxidoreductase [Alphaproteobacteria bacterium]